MTTNPYNLGAGCCQESKGVEHVHTESQTVHLKEGIKKDIKIKICEVYEQQKNNVCPKEEGLHYIFKGKTRVTVI